MSLKVTIERINPVLRGWFGYFKHASGGLHTAFFARLGLFELKTAHRLARQSMKMAH